MHIKEEWLLKPTKTTKQKRNRNLAEFYGRKWAGIIENRGFAVHCPFFIEKKTQNNELRKIGGK